MDLIIFDGYGIFFRSFYACRELSTSSGVPIAAVYGTIRLLTSEILKTTTNDAVNFVVALDGAHETFRDELYAGYKANRKDPPQELKSQFAILDEALEAMGIASFRIAGFEADDIIATIAKSHKPYGKVTIFTSDKDMMQLIDKNVKCFNPFSKEELDEDGVLEKVGLPVHQLLDYFAMMGDSSDGVPGIIGVGAKTAKKLVKDYGTIEEIYTKLADIELSPKIKETILTGKDSAFLSKQLIKLEDNVKIDCDTTRLKSPDIFREQFTDFLEKYEMKSILANINKYKMKSNTTTEPTQFNLI